MNSPKNALHDFSSGDRSRRQNHNPSIQSSNHGMHETCARRESVWVKKEEKNDTSALVVYYDDDVPSTRETAAAASSAVSNSTSPYPRDRP